MKRSYRSPSKQIKFVFLWICHAFLLACLISVVLFTSGEAWSAACCGGGSAAPSILSGEDRAQFSSMISNTDVVVDNVDSRGVWRSSSTHQQVQTMRVDGAHLIDDRWQFGASLPIIQRSYANESASGLADITASLAYEYLPDWDYNPYRPRGVGFVELVLPTGKSRAESLNGGLDSRGSGFWAVGFGTLLTKPIRKWDVFTSLEVHRSFAKQIETSQAKGTLLPGYGGIFSLGGGYNLRRWRLGAGIAWSYEDAIEVESTSLSRTGVERYATGTISLSYLDSRDWSANLSYADQTWFGDPVNTSLGRTVGLQLQRRWGR